jgi:hypothetical protein
MATCKDCGQQIHWLKFKDENGKIAPIEAERHKDGNLVISLEKGLYRFAKEAEYIKHRVSDTGPKLWISHFTRCPGAKKFRKAKAR